MTKFSIDNGSSATSLPAVGDDTCSDAIPIEEYGLTNCDREPISFPGKIQPHGVLLVLSPNTLEILQASENVEAFTGTALTELLNQPLSRAIGEKQTHIVKQALQTIQDSDQSESKHLGLFGFGAEQQATASPDTARCRSFLHASRDVVILELVCEPVAEAEPLPALEELQATLQEQVSQFAQAENLSALAQQIVRLVSNLTGFDRVMFYQFASDYSGRVIAEQMSPALADSFLGLRYPATDIPAQARELYLRNWSRAIPNAGYSPVSLIPERHPINQRPVDLSRVGLRSVSPMHTEYLQNMGVSASMSISLVVEDRLWGLIACHHSEPKQVSFEVRNTCEFLGQVASLEIFRQQMLIEKRYLADVRSIQAHIRQTLGRSHQREAIGTVLKQHQQELLTLVRANGAAIVLGDQLTLIGQTPTAERIWSLIAWLSRKRQDIYYTHSLSQEFAAFESEQECACGLLVISIFLAQSSYHVLWFRPELVQSVDWAGQPSKPATIAEDGTLYLTPRQSFERWKEAVHGQSLTWQSNEIGAAQELRSTLLLAALQFSQTALKKAASEAQIANKAKSQFLAKMSHELRTPLNAILGFSQLLHYHETLSAEQRDRLDIINRSGEHLLSLINDILETSRIEAGQLRLNENCFDLHRFIASVRDMLTLRASNKNLFLSVEQPPELPRYVWGDESKLRQIVTNLVGNAIKFTDKGSVLLAVSYLPDARLPNDADKGNADTACIQFKVSDTGIGIKAENFDTIFEPFRQAEISRQPYEGTGLGLSISRQNARLMGGDIRIKSQVNQGSTFTCQVRLGLRSQTDLATSSQPLRRVIALAKNQPRYRILVVEDVTENRQLLLSMLTTVGFDVRTAVNGKEAVDVWRQWQPHCILMDLYMPEVDGYVATQQIRAEQVAAGSGDRPAIIALSASVIGHSYRNLVSSGFDDYISKPFQINKIFDTIAQHIHVCYRYADPGNNAIVFEGKASKDKGKAALPIAPEQLSEMQSQLLDQSRAWKTDFYQAVLGAREQQIARLIEQLPTASLAQSLQLCLEQLRFDLLYQLVEPLAPNSYA